MSIKVIFLDVDGVLNSVRSMIAYHDEDTLYNGDDVGIQHRLRHRIDPVAVKLLNRVTDCNPEVKYVISSTHRKHIPDLLGKGRDMKYMNKYFADFGLTGEVVGYTPCSNNGHRGTEIMQWLEHNLSEVGGISHYAIIDDDSDMTKDQMKYHFVHTDNEDGFSYANFKQLLVVLDCKQRT